MKNRRMIVAALIGVATGLGGCVIVKSKSHSVRDSGDRAAEARPERGSAELEIGRVLDALHDAASKADGARYFGLFSADAVFIGTDASERWPIAEFKRYAQERFDTGKGWTYTVTERHIDLSPGGNVAWFDEMLHNAKYGVCRGSGVLVREGGVWKIAQYNLSVPVPNDLMEGVARQIREFEASQKAK